VVKGEVVWKTERMSVKRIGKEENSKPNGVSFRVRKLKEQGMK